jgi:hypothetical protein
VDSRARVVRRDAVERAKGTAKRIASESAFANDPDVYEEILQQLAVLRDPTGTYAPSELAELVAAHAKAAELELDGWIRSGRNWALAITVALVTILVGAVDIATGPGDIPDVDELQGWHRVAYFAYVLLGLIAVGLAIWLGVDWWTGRARLEKDTRDLVKKEKTRLTAELDAVLEHQWVRPAISRVLAVRQSPTFRSHFKTVDVENLYGPPLEILKTTTYDLLEELLTPKAGSSIGLCGPRGAGKTTLIRWSCKSKGVGESVERLGIHTDVPVAYDQRDFLANLYSQLLDEFERRAGGVSQAVGRSRWYQSFFWRRLSIPIFLLIIIAGGAWVLFSPEMPQGLLERAAQIGLDGDRVPSELRWAVFGAALVATALVATRSLRRQRRAPRTSGRFSRVWRELDSARDMLKADITTSASVGGSVRLFGAGSLETAGGRQASRGPVSYPALVRAIRLFVESLVDTGLRIRIGIDELDKLSPEEARTFLNGLKAVFGLSGTHFVVSVSEDAMSDFERRGVPIRDAFDTSLDEVVRLDVLSVAESMRLLSARSDYAFPLSFGALCHCLSGGLPRELLRVARKLGRANSHLRGSTDFGLMTPLCWQLIDDDLTAKSRAIWVAARGSSVEPYGTRFRSWLAMTDESRQDSSRLLAACQEYLRFPMIIPSDFPLTGEDLVVLYRLHSLTLEFVGYRYFAATLFEFFSSTSDERLRQALDARAGEGSLNVLSTARMRFSDDPRLAWSLVSQFRRARHMPPVLGIPPEGLRLPVPAGSESKGSLFT